MSNEILNAALKYAKMGFAVFPCSPDKKPATAHGFKDATMDKRQIKHWFSSGQYMIGIACGAISGGLLLIDLDRNHGNSGADGVRVLDEWEKKNGRLPDTVCVNTPSGGVHLWFTGSDEITKNITALYAGVDIKTGGGYLIAPPSHGQRGDYTFADGCGIDDIPVAPIDDNVRNFINSGSKTKRQNSKKKTGSTGATIPEGGRNDSLFRLACALRNNGLSVDTVLDALKKENISRCKPPLTDTEIDTIVNSAFSYETDNLHKWSKNGKPVDIIDDAIAERMITDHPMICHYGKLYYYDGGVYRQDADGSHTLSVAGSYMYDDLRSHARMMRVYKLLLTKQAIRKADADINNFPKTWVNFRNGFLDLKTLKMHNHDVKYFSLNQLPHEWKDDCKNGITQDFLTAIIPNAADREMFLQYAGYSCTTDMHLQKMLIIVGEGGIGKSVLLKLFEWLIGKENIVSLTLQGLNERFDTAFLVNKLINIYGDLPSKDMPETNGIKTITGEDQVRGEYKGGDIFTFRPYCKLLFSCNRIPKTRDERTTAYYRRLLILPIKERAREFDDLEARLKDDIDSFVCLAIHAAHKMYAVHNGKITTPISSINAVQQLYYDTDTVEAFLFDNNYGHENPLPIERGALYAKYITYCRHEQRAAVTRNGFFAALREKGYADRRNAGNRFFLIGARSDTFVSDSFEK